MSTDVTSVALLADIHGNAPALAAVLAAARAAGAQQLLVAGDLVGYYYAPDEVLRLLDEWEWSGVRGNHEEMFAADDLGRWSRYGSGLLEARARLTAAQARRLVSLPHPVVVPVGGRRALVAHGTPWDIGEYVYPDAPDEVRHRLVQAGVDAGADLVVLGHTHHPLVWPGAVTVVNPGSVGQPRDRNPAASWALWDVGRDAVTLHRAPYDPATVIEECRARDPEITYLTDVLLRRA